MNSADLLLHPVRLRLVQKLLGRRMTPGELIEALGDVPQASVYRHLKLLVAGGLLHVVAERPVRGGVERTYAVVEDAVGLGGESLDGIEPEDHRRYFAAFLGTLLGGFDRYLRSGRSDFAADGVGYQQTPMWLTDQEFAELAETLGGLLRQGFANQPGPGRRRRLVSTVVFPDAG